LYPDGRLGFPDSVADCPALGLGSQTETIRRRGHALITLAPLHLPKQGFQALIAMDGRTNDISIRGLIDSNEAMFRQSGAD
jgi:hypothetical protein